MSRRSRAVVPRWVAQAVVVAVGLAGVGGCTSSGGKPEASEPADRSTVAYVDRFDPDEQPLAEFTADAVHEEGQVKVQVLSLEVTGDVMLLRMVLTPLPLEGSSQSVNVYSLMRWGGTLTLADVEHMVCYEPLNTGDLLHYWMADGVDFAHPNISRGVDFLYWAYFDAPDERVDQLDLTFGPGWPVVEDVPVVWS